MPRRSRSPGRTSLAPMFTPGSLPEPGPDGKQGTIQMPGTVGGADWTGAAFDPETGMLYVPSMTGPIAQNVMPGNPEVIEPAISSLE